MMDLTLSSQLVDPEKAKLIQPFSYGYYPNTYVSPGQLVKGEVESREMEVAILAAYDYGIPPSVIGSANSGLRQFNTQNLSGAPLNVAGWLSFYALSEAEYLSNYSTRAQIFSAYGSGAGWNPQP